MSVLLVVLMACAAPPATTPALEGPLQVIAPPQLRAGEPLLVLVRQAHAPDGLPVTLVAQSSYGTRVYRATFSGGAAQLLLPSTDTRSSGLVGLMVTAGAAQGQATTEIRAGSAVDPITPLLGPRSISADGRAQTMVLAIPFDSYGNPLDQGAPIVVLVQYPDGRTVRLAAAVSHLVVWQHIVSSTAAGRTVLSVTAQDAHGPEASVVQVAGLPVPFGISASPAVSPADGQRLITLRTTPIRDRAGNQIPDGTLVTFLATAPDGALRTIPAITIGGVAEALLQAPAVPAPLRVRASLFGVQSRPLTLTFAPGPATGAIPLSVAIRADDRSVRLTAGPLLGALGQFAPEGTPVRFVVRGPDGAPQELIGVATNGRAGVELRLASLVSGRYTVTAESGAGRGQTAFDVP